ncbi:hypothetical protein [Stakelama tenebrarum]|uniref:DUF4153 domain-containing protein n=1 Tax=Stakelama tenebrarum TaxID=2711215 RepID=A0A6G6Y928_9SPHN|nr:hypothetical protein [Sphingosinithalassobacter tenebrarum]QIG81351.1 hypothetical protein G5C33_17215 [Sphingosinithalassobacter tenebrarum]
MVEAIGAIGAIWTIGGTVWFLLAARTGVDSDILFETFVSRILPPMLLWGLLAGITVAELLRWWRRHDGIERTAGLLLYASMLLAIAVVGWSNLKSLSRSDLIVDQLGAVARAGCTGDHATALARLDRLQKSPRFSFLDSRIESFRNRLALLDYLQAGLPARADASELEARYLVFGFPPLAEHSSANALRDDWLRPACRAR